MSIEETTAYRVLTLDLEIREYPILRDEIRKRMREEMFRRGIIREELFEEEVRLKAITTQRREGLNSPQALELAEVWELRCSRVRDMLTDFYFAHNLPHSIFHDIVADALGERNKTNLVLSFNPETAPWDLLFAQAAEFESGDDETRKRTEHHLKEIIVVLTKGMLSDQLGFVGIARQHLKISDLQEVRQRRIGRGKVGGKAAGMSLAWRVLQTPTPGDPMDIGSRVRIPESFYVAADAHYQFLEENNLFGGVNLKYKDIDRIREEYDEFRTQYDAAHLPESLVKKLDDVLDRVGDAPLIARSSSLLEDNFGSAFAGKYESHFLPNQGERRERLEKLCHAVRRIYASGLNPDAMAYRKQMGLVDYDERMGVMLQKVEGAAWRGRFFPQVSGVAFSHNPYRWSTKIDRRSGLLRLAWGLGTRTVNRVDHDFPRLVALSHPHLRPEHLAGDLRRYSQQFVDAIDLRSNAMVTLPVRDLVSHDYPGIRYIASSWEDGEVRPIKMSNPGMAADQYVITFDQLLHENNFVQLMHAILQKLERAYRHPVDIEFTVEILPGPDFCIHLLQCRPQVEAFASEACTLQRDIPKERIVFSSPRSICCGHVPGIRYVIFVDPERYAGIGTDGLRRRIARVVGKLNRRLEGNGFMFVGPGRWGSTNPAAGVPVCYADIYKADAIVEVPIREEQPDPAFGTHLFQDLIESRIYPVQLHPDRGDWFDLEFFRKAPNMMAEILPDDADISDHIRLIDVPMATGGMVLDLTLADGQNEGVLACLMPKG